MALARGLAENNMPITTTTTTVVWLWLDSAKRVQGGARTVPCSWLWTLLSVNKVQSLWTAFLHVKYFLVREVSGKIEPLDHFSKFLWTCTWRSRLQVLHYCTLPFVVIKGFRVIDLGRKEALCFRGISLLKPVLPLFRGSESGFEISRFFCKVKNFRVFEFQNDR